MTNIAKIIRDYKVGSGCYNCEEHDPDMLDFYKLSNMSKANISNMVTSNYDLRTIMGKVVGTIVVCQPCYTTYHNTIQYKYKIDTSNNQLSYIFEE